LRKKSQYDIVIVFIAILILIFIFGKQYTRLDTYDRYVNYYDRYSVEIDNYRYDNMMLNTSSLGYLNDLKVVEYRSEVTFSDTNTATRTLKLGKKTTTQHSIRFIDPNGDEISFSCYADYKNNNQEAADKLSVGYNYIRPDDAPKNFISVYYIVDSDGHFVAYGLTKEHVEKAIPFLQKIIKRG